MDNNVSLKEFCEKLRQNEVAVELAKEFLMSAIKKRQVEFCYLCISLLKGNIPVKALFEATKNGYVEIVKLLLEARADVHANNDQALRRATNNGNAEVVELLVEAGADVHADNDYAMYTALHKRYTAVVEILRAAMK